MRLEGDDGAGLLWLQQRLVSHTPRILLRARARCFSSCVTWSLTDVRARGSVCETCNPSKDPNQWSVMDGWWHDRSFVKGDDASDCQWTIRYPAMFCRPVSRVRAGWR